MDIEVHPEGWKKEFGFGKAMALPLNKKPASMKKSKSLHDTPDLIEDPTPAKSKKGHSLAGKLKRFMKIKKRKTDTEVTVSKQALIPTSPSFVPNSHTVFAVHTPSNPTSYGSTDQLNVSAEEQVPSIAKGLDVDDIPAYARHILDIETTGSPAATSIVRVSCSSPAGMPDWSIKLYSFSRDKKFGFSLSPGIPPIEVSHVVPGGQAASVGLGVGSAVVEVNGENCSTKNGREIRDLIHLGKVVRYSPSLGVQDRVRISGFNQSGQNVSGKGFNSFDQDLASVDEDTWEKMKKMEESIHSKSSGTKETRNSGPLFAKQYSEPKNTGASPIESPHLKTKFTHAGSKGSSQMMSATLGESPLQHSTPVYVKGEGTEEQVKSKFKSYSSSLLSSDEGTSPIDELPRASLVLPDVRSNDLQRPGCNLSTSSSESGPILNLPRASVTASLNEAGSLPGIPESESNVVCADERNSAYFATNIEPFSYLDSNPPRNGPKSKKSPNVAFRTSKHSPATHSKQRVRSSPGVHSKTRKTFKNGYNDADDSDDSDAADDNDDDRSSSEGFDEDDIVKSFEEVIASSPSVSPAKLANSSGFVNLNPSQSPTPQWLFDADMRRNTELTEAESKILNKKSILKKASAGSKKQLNFAELPPPSSSPHGELKHSLSGELLALDSNFYVKKPLSKYDRARSMEEGININRDSDFKSSISIESNVRRKKSGLMVGKRTSHNTSRPSILGYGEGGETEGAGGDESRRMSIEFGYQMESPSGIHHSRSLSDELVIGNETSLETSPSLRPRPPKSPVLLGVNEGRSRLMVGKQRKRRKPSRKQAVLLDTTEECKYSEVRIDLASPKSPEQPDRDGRGGKPSQTNAVPTMPKPLLKKPANVTEKNKELAEEDKFKNLVIGASWGVGGGQGGGGGRGGPITRRSTYSARTSTATTAALVAQAAAKKSQELNKTIICSEQDADKSLNVLQRTSRHSSTNARLTTSQHKTKPKPQNEDKGTPSSKPSTILSADGEDVDKNSRSLDAGAGVQTFKVPLRKVPQNTRLWGKEVDPHTKSKESLGSSKPRANITDQPTNASSSPSSGPPPAVQIYERSDSSVPKSGHVKDKLKLFSQMT